MVIEKELVNLNQNKMTAVEWYKQELNKIELSYMNKVIDRIVYMDLKSQAFEQAKEMEKHQTIEFGYDVADDLAYGVLSKKAIEDKYNETFKSE